MDTYTGDPRDPLSLNLYTYCRNNPVRRYDPSGQADVPVDSSNISQGNKVKYETITWRVSGKTTNIIKVETRSGEHFTLFEGQDYYVSGGKSYYTNKQENMVRQASGSSYVWWSKGEQAGKSAISLWPKDGIGSYRTLTEGTDFYIGDDGRAYYYSNVRTGLEAGGNAVEFIAGSGGAPSKIQYRPAEGAYPRTTLAEGTDYYIGADSKAHWIGGGAPPPDLTAPAPASPSPAGTAKPTKDMAAASGDAAAAGTKKFIWPVDSQDVSGRYGADREGNSLHHGIDISVKEVPVKATAGGKVITISETKARGKYIYMDHGNGSRSVYEHLKEVDDDLKQGNYVVQGRKIATSGNSGTPKNGTYPPHLHFELMLGVPDGERDELGSSPPYNSDGITKYHVNPIEYLEK
jgi:murein DD-endopeptidase MepM/ murein hydrolase activator NlpD